MAGTRPAERARRFAQYPYALLRDLLGGQLSIHAMGLVYATLLALVPIVQFMRSELFEHHSGPGYHSSCDGMLPTLTARVTPSDRARRHHRSACSR
jgi:hypothetical protein